MPTLQKWKTPTPGMRISVPTCLMLTLSATLVGAADWPTYQHDNRRTGISSERLAPPLALRWVFDSPFPPAAGWARPVNGYGATKNASNVSFDDALRVTSVGAVAYFASSAENIVYAVDAARGTVRWKFYTDAPPRLAPTVWRGKVYFGSDDGKVYCLRANDGSVVWKVDAAPTDEQMLGTGRIISLWPVRCGVTVEKGVAYFTAGLFPSEGIYLYAVDAESGDIVWRRQLDSGGLDGPSPQGYLLASNDSIYTTSRTAPARWSIADGSPIQFATPIPHHEYRFHNGGSYAQLWGENIVYGQAAILAFDPNKVLFDKYNRPRKGDLIFNWFNARRVLFADGLAYVATDYHLLAVRQDLLGELAATQCQRFEAAYKRHGVASYLTALQTFAEHGEDSPLGRRLTETTLKWGREKFQQWPAATEELFRAFAKKCRWMTPLCANEAMILAADVIYAGGENEVLAVDAATGKRLWSHRTGSRVRGLAIANRRLFVSTVDGNVRCYAHGEAAAAPRQVLAAATKSPYQHDRLSEFYANTARRILDDSQIKKGYCLILSGGAGRLAYELARRTELNIYVLEPDPQEVQQTRATLTAAGLYGGRITVQQSALGSLPYPPYLFNLIIDQGAFFGAETSTPAAEILRVLKPCGGVAYLGQPPGGEALGTALPTSRLEQRRRAFEAPNVHVSIDGAWAKILRGRIECSADWTHNYATAANTYCSEDPLVKGPFGILWYGRPGPRSRIDRHATPPMPLVAGAIMFLTGYDRIMAYDIYNGVPYWERTIVGATRTGLPLGTSNIVADARSLFIVVADKTCLRLDAKTGKTLQTYRAPTGTDAEEAYWGWIAQHGDLLYGSRAETDRRRRRADPRLSNAVFAVDVATRQLRWVYDGKGIDHDGIAIGDGKLFLVDRNLTAAQRSLAIENTFRDESVEDREAIDRRGEPIPPDLRKLVAIDAATGTLQWQRPIDVTDITLDDTAVSDGRVGVACMVKDKVVVVHGTGSLGHPYQEFLRGEFRRRAMYAHHSETGEMLWGGRRNYRKRPIIVGQYVYAEPHAWHLQTGKPKTVAHPISGRQEPFDFFRGYIGCSHLLGSAAALFGNNNGIAHLNLDATCGYTPLGNMSLACGLGAVPAGGIYVAPEGRAGCTCATPIFTSIALYPRRKARCFSVGIPGGVSAPKLTPVKHVSINLGAPGFRQDDHGALWIPYPARGAEGILGDWLPAYRHSAEMCYRHSDDLLTITGTDMPWVFTSGYSHTKPLQFTLLDPGQEPAVYTVRLYFAEPEDLTPGQRVFQVTLQGETVLTEFDVAREAGGVRKALVREFPGVEVRGDLVVALQPAADCQVAAPILSGIAAARE